MQRRITRSGNSTAATVLLIGLIAGRQSAVSGQTGYSTVGSVNPALAAPALQENGATGSGPSGYAPVGSDGVFAAGDNGRGQLGIGEDTWSPKPSLMADARMLAAGEYHSLALKTDGTVWAWADNGSGQLGDGTTTNSTTPVPVSGPTGATAIGTVCFFAWTRRRR